MTKLTRHPISSMIEMRAAVAFSSDDFEENCAILPVCNAFQQKICEGFQFERILSEPLTDVIVEKTAISQMPQKAADNLRPRSLPQFADLSAMQDADAPQTNWKGRRSSCWRPSARTSSVHCRMLPHEQRPS
jgi:hypothetical protein